MENFLNSLGEYKRETLYLRVGFIKEFIPSVTDEELISVGKIVKEELEKIKQKEVV